MFSRHRVIHFNKHFSMSKYKELSSFLFILPQLNFKILTFCLVIDDNVFDGILNSFSFQLTVLDERCPKTEIERILFNLRLFSISQQTNIRTTNDYKRDYQRAKLQSLC